MVLRRLRRSTTLLAAMLFLPGCSLLTDLDELRGTGVMDGALHDLGTDSAADLGHTPDQRPDGFYDLPVVDGPVADKAATDGTVPDTRDHDQFSPDLASEDMPPVDQAPLDKTDTPDTARPLDLAQSPDLAQPPDLTVLPDLAQSPDQKVLPDQNILPDLPAKLATVIVDTTGTDLATCGSVSSPCLSVNFAMNRVLSPGLVQINNGSYMDYTQKFPITLRKGVTIKGAGGANLVTFKGPGPLLRCGANGANVSGAKVEGIGFQVTGNTQPAIACAEVKGTPNFSNIKVINQGIMLNKADALLYKVTWQSMVAGAHGLVVDNAPTGATPQVRESTFHGSKSGMSVCVHLKAMGQVDLGTKGDSGGNDFRNCDYVAICNETSSGVFAVGNTWKFGPLTQGNKCNGTWPIGNTASGGKVVTN